MSSMPATRIKCVLFLKCILLPTLLHLQFTKAVANHENKEEMKLSNYDGRIRTLHILSLFDDFLAG